MVDQGRLRPIVIYLILLLVVCLLFYYYKEIYHAFRDTIRFFSNKGQVSALVVSFGVFAPLVFMGLQILQVLLAPIPGELTGFVGGYLFGAAWGFLFSSIGLSIGSLLAFLISRRLGLPFVRRFIGEELMRKFDYLMEHQGAFFSFLYFLIPGLPKDYFCYLLGLSPMHIFTFFIVSSIGRIPGTLLLSLQGQAVRSENYRIFFVILGVALFFILLTILYREKVEAWLKRKK
ncbi:MAG: TVP38/TMEM64 family protein [Thermodesulfobacteriota bacterium]